VKQILRPASVTNWSERIHGFIWQLFFSSGFKRFGKNIRFVAPDIIKGEQAISIGNNVYMGRRGWLQVLDHNADAYMNIGDDTYIGRHVHIVCHDAIDIEAEVLIADKVYISDNSHDYRDINLSIRFAPVKPLKPVSIGRGSWLGENVCVIGASVGKHSVIGSNSVVLNDIPNYCIAVGTPAKIVKRYSESSGKWESC